MIEYWQIVDLTQSLDDPGGLIWDVPSGSWLVPRIGYTTTGRRNRASTRAGRGYECDKLDPTAVDFHFDQYLGKIQSSAGEAPSPPVRELERQAR